MNIVTKEDIKKIEEFAKAALPGVLQGRTVYDRPDQYTPNAAELAKTSGHNSENSILPKEAAKRAFEIAKEMLAQLRIVEGITK